MKKCTNCGWEGSDDAKFCSQCGSPLEEETKQEEEALESLESVLDEQEAKEPENENTDNGFILVDEPETAQPEAAAGEETGTESEPEAHTEEVKEEQAQPDFDPPIWYFVENGASSGPYSESQMKEFYDNGRINKDTYIWKNGLSEWTLLKNTELDAKFAPQPEVVEAEVVSEQPEIHEAKAEWYYVVDNSKTMGPYTLDAMIQSIESDLITPKTYVWKEGMADWEHASQTELNAYFKTAQNTAGNTFAGGSFQSGPAWNNTQSTQQPYQGTYQAPKPPVRSVVLFILLSVVTCGIFYLAWVYMMAKDLNELAAREGKQQGCDPVLSVIFSIFTCGIYSIYYYWKEGNMAYDLDKSDRFSNSGVLLAVLAIFIPIASAAILQDQINTIIQNG